MLFPLCYASYLICWDDLQEKAWNDVKSLIVSAPVLAYYRSGEVLEIQCDSSQSGLGAALMRTLVEP